MKPSPLSSFSPPPQELDDGLWVLDRALRMPFGLTMPTRMVVIRLGSGGLLLHSPVKLDPAVGAALELLGRVEAIVAPNSFHHLFVSEYVSAWAGARLYVAPGLLERVPGLPLGVVLTSQPPAAWTGVVEQTVFGPIRGVSEVVLFHRPSATLVLTDLAFNLREIDGTYNRLAWRLAGVPSRFGPSRTARLTLLRDPAAAGPYLAKVLDWDFGRIVVAHGEVVEENARGEFSRAFARYLCAGRRLQFEPT